MSLITRLLEKALIWKWSRSQHDNQKLRRHFRTRYRIDVGYFSYGCFDRWRMPGPITVGRYCSIASSVRSVPINHPSEALTTHPVLYERKFGAVDENINWDETLAIEDDVWIGHNVVILPGCRFIGRGSIIGAGSIVTHNVERYTVVAGNPARKLRDRFASELIEKIEASRWWELDARALRALKVSQPDVLFRPDLENLSRFQVEDFKQDAR